MRVPRKSKGFQFVPIEEPKSAIDSSAQDSTRGNPPLSLERLDSGTTNPDPSVLPRLAGPVIEEFLQTGVKSELDAFYEKNIGPKDSALLHSPALLRYFLTKLLVTTSRFVRSLGGIPSDVLLPLQQPKAVISQIRTSQELREYILPIVSSALDFRDRNTGKQSVEIITKARKFIDNHFADANISLHQVAAHISLSANHFSLLFARETGETFVKYLMHRRIEKAKELLRNTKLNTKEISFEIGYKNPQYFSRVFQKAEGILPSEFRLKTNPEVAKHRKVPIGRS